MKKQENASLSFDDKVLTEEEVLAGAAFPRQGSRNTDASVATEFTSTKRSSIAMVLNSNPLWASEGAIGPSGTPSARQTGATRWQVTHPPSGTFLHPLDALVMALLFGVEERTADVALVSFAARAVALNYLLWRSHASLTTTDSGKYAIEVSGRGTPLELKCTIALGCPYGDYLALMPRIMTDHRWSSHPSDAEHIPALCAACGILPAVNVANVAGATNAAERIFAPLSGAVVAEERDVFRLLFSDLAKQLSAVTNGPSLISRCNPLSSWDTKEGISAYPFHLAVESLDPWFTAQFLQYWAASGMHHAVLSQSATVSPIGNHLLGVACHKNKIANVRQLLGALGPLTTYDANAQKAVEASVVGGLQLAIAADNCALFQVLTDAAVECPSLCSEHPVWSPHWLVYAARSRAHKVIGILSSHDVKDIGSQALHAAIRCGDFFLPTVQLLVESGSDVNTGDGTAEDLSPLEAAVTRGSRNTVKYLFSKGASRGQRLKEVTSTYRTAGSFCMSQDMKQYLDGLEKGTAS